MLEVDASLSRLTAWAGGIAVLEQWGDPDDPDGYAVQVSSDGRTWQRTVLPDSIEDVAWLEPLGGGLVIVDERHPNGAPGRFRLHLWQSSDGASWSQAGSIDVSLPQRLLRQRAWSIYPVEFIATDAGLTFIASVSYGPGLGGFTRDGVTFVSGTRTTANRSVARPVRAWGWTSPDGSAWTRQRVSGVVGPDGDGSLYSANPAGHGFLALREGGDALLTSRDGLRWRTGSALPSDFEWGGSASLLWADGAPLLFGDSSKAEGAEDCGDRLGAWRVNAEGEWIETLDRQPAHVTGAAADGATVLVSGMSWCVSRWGWVIGSSDGGRTWDRDLSWVGSPGSCRGEVAITDSIAVVEDCADDPSLLWATLPSASSPEDR